MPLGNLRSHGTCRFRRQRFFFFFCLSFRDEILDELGEARKIDYHCDDKVGYIFIEGGISREIEAALADIPKEYRTKYDGYRIVACEQSYGDAVEALARESAVCIPEKIVFAVQIPECGIS